MDCMHGAHLQDQEEACAEKDDPSYAADGGSGQAYQGTVELIKPSTH
jgi:hypothetical protein